MLAIQPTGISTGNTPRVCKRWRVVALALPSLWSTYHIILNSTDDLNFWSPCIPCRLRRCPPDTLLEIEIDRNWSPEWKWTPSEVEAVAAILFELTGQKGENARRWRRFVSSKGLPWLKVPEQIRILSYPTPNLLEFEMNSLNSSTSILPDAPILQRFDVGSMNIPSFPDLRNATDIHILSCRLFDTQAVSRAHRLTHLNIDLWTPYELSGHFPVLETLSIKGYLEFQDIDTCLLLYAIRNFSAPNIRDITLLFDRAVDYLEVAKCPGMRLERLKTAYIGWPHRIEDEPGDYVAGMEQFLRGARNLEELNMHGDHAAILVLKLLCDQCESLYQQGNPVRLILSDDYFDEYQEGILGQGEERRLSVNRFTDDDTFGELQGRLADASWDAVFEHIDISTRF